MTDTLTVYVSIGNSDDKLGQGQWHRFHRRFLDMIRNYADVVHGNWVSPSTEPWQNACVCFEIGADLAEQLKRELRQLASDADQDSIAWAESNTQFLTSCATCKGRGYVPDWTNGLSEEHHEPGKKPCPDCQDGT